VLREVTRSPMYTMVRRLRGEKKKAAQFGENPRKKVITSHASDRERLGYSPSFFHRTKKEKHRGRTGIVKKKEKNENAKHVGCANH